MTQKTMYPTIIGDYKTALTVAYNAGADTTVYVASTSFLPTAPNTCTVRIPNQTYLVTIKYTGKTNTTLTGVTVVEGTPTAALTAVFPVGSEVSKPLAHDDVDAIQDNISDLDSAKVDKETGKGLSTNDFTNALKTKLDGIETGAEVNVQSDWEETDTTSDAYIQNKPSSFTPSAHATTHASNGTDAITIAESQVTNLTSDLSSKADATTVNSHIANVSNPHSVTKTQVGLGNCDNTSDADKPISTATQTALDGKEPVFTKNTAFNKNFGTASGTVCQGDDSRLSDARTPTTHASTHASDGTDAITIAESQVTNLTTDLGNKVDKYQGTEYTGYYLVIDSDGNVTSKQLPRPYVLGEVLMYPPLSEARMSNKILIT